MIATTVKKTLLLETRHMKISQTVSRVLAALLRLLKSTKGVLVVAHGMLWRQSFNYDTPFRAATIADSFKYLRADNNIALRVAATIHGHNVSVNLARFLFPFSFMVLVPSSTRSRFVIYAFLKIDKGCRSQDASHLYSPPLSRLPSIGAGSLHVGTGFCVS